MWTKDNLLKMGATLVLVVGGVVIASKWVMPMLSKKPATTPTK